MELPGYQGPFQQDVNIDNDVIAFDIAVDKNKPDKLGNKPNEQ